MKKDFLPVAVTMIVTLLFMLFCFVACRSNKAVIQDSIREIHDTTTVHDSILIEYTPQLAQIDVPESNIEKVSKDTVSLLRNSLYESMARWDGGFLYHTLKSLPGAKLQDTVYVPKITKSHNEDKSTNREVSKKEVQIIEKELTLMEKFKLNTWWFIVLLCLPTLYKIVKWIISKILKR